MVQLKFNVSGHTQLSRNLRLFAKDLTHLREFFKEAIEIIEERSNALFSAEGKNVEKANPWAPLAASTIKARQKGWGYYSNTPSSPSTLRWTGRMQETKNKMATDQKGRLQFTTPYAVYHQGGGGKLPRRVIIDLDNATNAEIVRALQAKIQKDIGIFGRQA